MTLRFHLTPVRMAKIKTQVTAHAGEDVEQVEHFVIVVQCINRAATFEINMAVSQKIRDLSTSRTSYTTP